MIPPFKGNCLRSAFQGETSKLKYQVAVAECRGSRNISIDDMTCRSAFLECIRVNEIVCMLLMTLVCQKWFDWLR